MSFMLFPPEVNSGLMYAGAGAGPLISAATAWDELAADLEGTAGSYQTVIDNLTTGSWLGPSSTAMAAAAQPYVAWLQSAAVTAAQTSFQAKAAAAAYQSAFDATVPPAVIVANRALLAALIATNFLGQNTPAIAAAEAQYMEMWFQDGLTMDTYSALSQQAAALPQQTTAPSVGDGGTSANSAAAAQSTASSSTLLPDLQTLLEAYVGLAPSGDTTTTGWTSVLSDVGITGSLQSEILPLLTATTGSTEGVLLPIQGTYYAAMFGSMPVRMLISMSNSMQASQATLASNQALLNNVSQLVESKMQLGIGGVAGQLRSFGSSMQAQLASAHRLGGLSIPNAWQKAAPEMSRAAPLLPGTSVSEPTMSTGLPNSPFTQALMGAMSGRGMGSMGAKPAAAKVVQQSPAGG
ncbi:MAG: PPE family protein [Mycobacterium sp.]|nr:PPE family protein [Mycobacterium sp.]